jgi:hypothetical protein
MALSIDVDEGNFIATSQATCAGAADLIVPQRLGRRSVMIANQLAGADIYIGNSGVTTTTGVLVPQGSSIEIESSAAIYAATASATATVHVMEIYRQ